MLWISQSPQQGTTLHNSKMFNKIHNQLFKTSITVHTQKYFGLEYFLCKTFEQSHSLTIFVPYIHVHLYMYNNIHEIHVLVCSSPQVGDNSVHVPVMREGLGDWGEPQYDITCSICLGGMPSLSVFVQVFANRSRNPRQKMMPNLMQFCSDGNRILHTGHWHKADCTFAFAMVEWASCMHRTYLQMTKFNSINQALKTEHFFLSEDLHHHHCSYFCQIPCIHVP